MQQYVYVIVTRNEKKPDDNDTYTLIDNQLPTPTKWVDTHKIKFPFPTNQMESEYFHPCRLALLRMVEREGLFASYCCFKCEGFIIEVTQWPIIYDETNMMKIIGYAPIKGV